MTIDFSKLFENLEQTDFAVGNEKKSDAARTNYIGSKTSPFPSDVRFVVNTSVKEEMKPFHKADTHETTINGKYVTFPCLRNFNETCAVCDAHWSHREEAQKLENVGAKSEGHKQHGEWKKQTTLTKLFQQRKKFLALCVIRGENRFSVLNQGPALFKAIFGDPVKGVKGAKDEILAYGESFLDHRTNTGWITLNKTGTGLDTLYTAAPRVETKVVNKAKTQVLHEEPIHPDLVAALTDPVAVPKLLTDFAARKWSQEEMRAFVESEGTKLPEKVSKYVYGESSASAETTPGAVETASFDDLDVPF